MSSLIPSQVYRIAYNANQERLRGKPVVFKAYREPAYPIPYRRAIVSTFDGEELIVMPSCLINY